jgi:hypothetical protein
MTPKSSSDSGTEADDESTGLLKGLPAPPARPRKGLRGVRSNPESPDSGSAQDQQWLLLQSKSRDIGGGLTDRIDAETMENKRKTVKRRRIGFLRRLSETILLLAVGTTVLTGNEVRVAVRIWERGKLPLLTRSVN